MVENKNGSCELLVRRVYITSNKGWRNWWASDLLDNVNNEEAIVRRITVDKHFDVKYVKPVNSDIVTILGDDHVLQRQNAIVGNAFNELWCDEDQSFLNHHNANQEDHTNYVGDDDMFANGPLSPLGEVYGF